MSSRTRNRWFPLVGGMTAAATAAGGLAAVAHVAPAGAGANDATATLGASSLLGAGTMESCEAYFGSYGKSDGAMGLVEFDVADVDGADGVDHAADMDGDGDTDVVLVVEYEEGGTIECVPYELTPEMWESEHADFPFGGIPDYPGPGHYVYPSVNLPAEGDQPVSVGFRVAGVPADHTLVSPEGIKELDDVLLFTEAEFLDGGFDPRVLGYIEAEAGPEAADAFAEAFAACVVDADADVDFDDEDLQAAILVLLERLGLVDEGEIDTLDCFGVGILGVLASYSLTLSASVDYVEEIRLSLTEAPTSPAAPPAAAPSAAQPVSANPTFTG